MGPAATLAGLVLAGSELIDVDPIERGILATMLTVVLVAVSAAGPKGLVHRVLSLEPVVYLVRISYGTYLWHWPVIIVARDVAAHTEALLAITALTATALASLSFGLLEDPILSSPWLDRHQRLVISVGLAVSLVGGLVVMPRLVPRSPRIVHRGPAYRLAVQTGFHEVPGATLIWGRSIERGLPKAPTASVEAWSHAHWCTGQGHASC